MSAVRLTALALVAGMLLSAVEAEKGDKAIEVVVVTAKRDTAATLEHRLRLAAQAAAADFDALTITPPRLGDTEPAHARDEYVLVTKGQTKT